MSPHITLLMALHCHQPVGNFGWVIREAFERAYRPFLECVERHPSVKVSLHYTGCLIDWLEREEPQFLGRVAQLVAAGQVEMIGGGYYEPILPLIPERDRQAQLQQLSEKITALCGQRPCGAWLAERVWEPQVAGTLASAGFDYTIVDDTHIRAALGWSPQLKAQEDIFGFYLTEDEGRYLRLFPSSKRLRYWMPFHPVQETIQFLRGCPSGSIVTFADDGEKFGLWPGTHRWVYEEGWLEQFFTALEAESSWLHTSLFRECATTQPPAGRVYLPCTSYEEMTEWSGGHFRNFLVKYPESNWMHKRMLEVSRRVQALEDRPPRAATRVQHVAAARDALHHAQCNCAYWHGVFGGLYLQHLRHGIYQHLIAAEQHLEAAETAHTGGLVTSLDIDGDGLLETKLTTPALQLVVAPCRGAAVVECDVRSVGINLGNTLMRQPESYHAVLVKAKTQHATVGGEQPKSIHDLLGAKESGLESFLLYDRYPRWSALDHLLAERPSVEQVTRSETTELIDPLGLYRCQPEPARRGVTAAALRGERLASLHGASGGSILRLHKRLSVHARQAQWTCQWRLDHVEREAWQGWAGLEWNIALRDPRYLAPRWLEHVTTLTVEDPDQRLRVIFTTPVPLDVCAFPVETVSGSEEGLERTYQGLCLWWGASAACAADAPWILTITQTILPMT